MHIRPRRLLLIRVSSSHLFSRVFQLLEPRLFDVRAHDRDGDRRQDREDQVPQVPDRTEPLRRALAEELPERI